MKQFTIIGKAIQLLREYDTDTRFGDVNNGHRKFAQILIQKGATELSLLLFNICSSFTLR
jgi:hypothetical protein